MANVGEQAEFRDGRWNGRTVREWLPSVVDDVVRTLEPQRVILFGSLASGDEGPESDADLLVVVDHVGPVGRTGAKIAEVAGG